jgi:hypothetical protein
MPHKRFATVQTEVPGIGTTNNYNKYRAACILNEMPLYNYDMRQLAARDS